jgi:hypothetical protein
MRPVARITLLLILVAALRPPGHERLVVPAEQGAAQSALPSRCVHCAGGRRPGRSRSVEADRRMTTSGWWVNLLGRSGSVARAKRCRGRPPCGCSRSRPSWCEAGNGGLINSPSLRGHPSIKLTLGGRHHDDDGFVAESPAARFESSLTLIHVCGRWPGSATFECPSPSAGRVPSRARLRHSWARARPVVGAWNSAVQENSIQFITLVLGPP